MGSKHATVMAVRVLLTPIVQVFSLLGFGYRDFVEAAKSVYVEVALAQDRRFDRRVSISRIARVSGITRREASRLFGVVSVDPVVYADPSAAISNLLDAWHTDPRYTDADGSPLQLPIEGEISLETLLRRYSGESDTTTLIRELVKVRAIDVRPGHARAMMRDFYPQPYDTLGVQRFAAVLHDVGSACAAHVLGRNGDLMHENRVVVHGANPESRLAFREFVAARTTGLLAEVRSWLRAHDEGAAAPVRLGVGTYLIDENSSSVRAQQ